MSYRIVFSGEAEADFGRMPPLVASSLLDGIDALSACPDPYKVCVPGFLPYRAAWIFQYRCEVDGDRWLCNVAVAIDQVKRLIELVWIHPQKVPDYDWR